MKKFRCIYVPVILQLLFMSVTKAQVSPEVIELNVGDEVPNLVFGPLLNNKAHEVRLSDLEGKLVILDFWATWCPPCIGTIPKNDSLQKQFDGKLQFILASSESRETVDSYFANYKRLKGRAIGLPSVFGPSILNQYFPHTMVPHYVWISPARKIIAITDSHSVNEKNIASVLLSGELSAPTKLDRRNRNDIDPIIPFFNERLTKPMFIKESRYGKNNIEYRAVITKYVENLRSAGSSFNYNGRIIHTNATVLAMYRNAYAFMGDNYDPVHYSRVLINVKDRLPFDIPKDRDGKYAWMRDHLYISDLVLPKYYDGAKIDATSDSLRRIACEIDKKNLDSFFRYDSSIQKRWAKCLVLKCTDTTKLATQEVYSKYVEVPGKLGATFNNRPFSFFFFKIKEWLESDRPIIDETGYTGKVNIKIDAPLLDYKMMNIELKKFGLELIEEDRYIDFLVINDK
jgi:thiol-disulfide isomerase/thioredoxin